MPQRRRGRIMSIGIPSGRANAAVPMDVNQEQRGDQNDDQETRIASAAREDAEPARRSGEKGRSAICRRHT